MSEAAVMGGSAGAQAATQFAIRYPQRTRALVRMVPAGYRPEPARETSRFNEWLFNTTLGSDFPLWLMLRFVPNIATRLLLGTPQAEYAAASPQERHGTDRDGDNAQRPLTKWSEECSSHLNPPS
jgi:pimeloyl-ACP methyl ester carboxylesterase